MNFSFNSYWKLDVNQTAPFEITLVHLSVCLPLSVCRSFTKFPQD